MDTPPPQISWSGGITNRYIPAEISEEILLNLPIKSLLRFSSASKSWNSIIHEAHFMKKYPGNDERIILHDPSLGEFFSCPLSAVLSNSNTPIEQVTNHVFPLNPSDGVETLGIIDVCNGLWFVESRKNKSIFVWNPSLRTYRKLSWHMGSSVLCYGLGYDSVGDDYKLLKIRNHKVVLYSLRTNYFRRIKTFFPMMKRYVSVQYKSCCVRGTLHWLCKAMSDYYIIFSFDLSTEEYGQLALPPEYSPTHELEYYEEVTVLWGKLCLSLNYWEKSRLVLWMMDDYGVVESWTKMFDFDYRLEEYRYGLRPLYICDNWQNSIFVNRFTGECWAMMNKDGKTLLKKNLGSRQIYGLGFVYVESLVSPAMPRHRTTLLDDARDTKTT